MGPRFVATAMIPNFYRSQAGRNRSLIDDILKRPGRALYAIHRHGGTPKATSQTDYTSPFWKSLSVMKGVINCLPYLGDVEEIYRP